MPETSLSVLAARVIELEGRVRALEAADRGTWVFMDDRYTVLDGVTYDANGATTLDLDNTIIPRSARAVAVSFILTSSTDAVAEYRLGHKSSGDGLAIVRQFCQATDQYISQSGVVACAHDGPPITTARLYSSYYVSDPSLTVDLFVYAYLL
jgi:hypothetical protein